MTQTSPFTPDDSYCVYCHAIAAGVCAACGALCCGDCVDLVMGLTTRRAVCHGCIEAGRQPGDVGLRRWVIGGLIAIAVAGGALLLWIS